MDFNKFKDVENIKKEGIALWNDIVSEVKQLKNINGEKFKSGFNTYFVDYLKNDYVKFDGMGFAPSVLDVCPLFYAD